MKNYSVIHISNDGLIDILGQSKVIPFLVELSKIGYRITILSCKKERNQ